MPGPQHPLDQSSYQVRFEWGVAGLARLAASDVVVVVDVLGFSAAAISAVERGEAGDPDAAARASSTDGAAVAQAATGLVLTGGLRNAASVARAILAEQQRRGARTSIAVIAAGKRDPGASVRFAVEDLLGAGAVIDALSNLGVDHSSPEAAVAGEGFRALRGAVKHLLTASGSGRELEADRRDEILAAAAVDAASVVPVLRDGVFTAL